MQVRYNKYFKHWRDFDLLTCILAFIGLILAIVDYETYFAKGYVTNSDGETYRDP